MVFFPPSTPPRLDPKIPPSDSLKHHVEASLPLSWWSPRPATRDLRTAVERRWLRGCCCWKSWWLLVFLWRGRVSIRGETSIILGGDMLISSFPYFFLESNSLREERVGSRCLKTVGGKHRLTHFGAYAQRPNWEFIFSAWKPPSKFEWNLTWMF